MSFNSANDTTGLYFKKDIVFRGDISLHVEETEVLIPDFELVGNYPNPFNSSTIIEYYVRESAEIQIVLYDVLGRKVADILNEEITPGNHKVSFDAGKLNLSSGVYFLNYTAVKHKAKLYNTTSKIVYLK